jgi:hypothetical protein
MLLYVWPFLYIFCLLEPYDCLKMLPVAYHVSSYKRMDYPVPLELVVLKLPPFWLDLSR